MAVASLPRQTWTAWGAMHALKGVLVSMRFVATPLGRDPRLDLADVRLVEPGHSRIVGLAPRLGIAQQHAPL